MIHQSSKKKSVIFFTDFGSSSGNGHLSRSLILRNIFGENYKAEIITEKKFPYKSNFSKYYNCNISKFLKNNKRFYDFAIIDSYKVNYSTEIKIKKICKKLISIDDYQKKTFISDFVINYSPYKNLNKFYNTKLKKTKYLLGDKYNFIRTFSGPLPKKHNPNFINLFIYLGKNKKRIKIIKKTLLKVKKNNFFKNIFVVGLKKFSINLKNIKFFQMVSKKKFSELMEKSDILILSAGISLHEGIFLNKKIFSLPVAKNQKMNYDYFIKKKKIKNFKSFSKFINYPKQKILKELKQKKQIKKKNIKKNYGLINIKNIIKI